MTFGLFISESTEYCQPGEFSANCGPHDVLLVTSAKYGRMRLGKCVKIDYGSIGCAADVLSEMDRKCSGRHECTFDIDSLHGKQPCPGDLTPYLEARYECISGKCRKQLNSNYSKLVCPFYLIQVISDHLHVFIFSNLGTVQTKHQQYQSKLFDAMNNSQCRSHIVTLAWRRTHSVATTLPQKVM